MMDKNIWSTDKPVIAQQEAQNLESACEMFKTVMDRAKNLGIVGRHDSGFSSNHQVAGPTIKRA